ncbi:MAG: MFS transporter [Geminicoccaceae bacterium]
MADSMRIQLAMGVNKRIFYGWVMVLVAMAGYFASGPGQSHIFSVFIMPLATDLDLDQTEISLAYALATLAAAFGLPYIGRLIDRYGMRRVVLIATTLLGFAAMAFGRVQGLIMLCLLFGALRFLGQGTLMLSSANLVGQWFNAKRGFAASLMGLGFSASVALHPPFAQWLIDQVGWRDAWFWLGIATWVFYLPLVFILAQNKPEDIGLLPDGADEAAIAETRAVGQASDAEIGLTSAEALRTSAFWITALALSSFSMLVTALFFYQVSIFQAQGLPEQIAARVFPISAIAMVCFMPIFGRLLDRLPTKPMFAAAILLMTASMISLVFVHDLTTAVIYAVIFGLNNAAAHGLIGYVWPHFFGRKHLGSIQGTAATIMVVGASIGPLPFGAAYDATGSYQIALLTLALLPVLCAIAVLLMRPPDLRATGSSAV